MSNKKRLKMTNRFKKQAQDLLSKIKIITVQFEEID